MALVFDKYGCSSIGGVYEEMALNRVIVTPPNIAPFTTVVIQQLSHLQQMPHLMAVVYNVLCKIPVAAPSTHSAMLGGVTFYQEL